MLKQARTSCELEWSMNALSLSKAKMFEGQKVKTQLTMSQATHYLQSFSLLLLDTNCVNAY